MEENPANSAFLISRNPKDWLLIGLHAVYSFISSCHKESYIQNTYKVGKNRAVDIFQLSSKMQRSIFVFLPFQLSLSKIFENKIQVNKFGRLVAFSNPPLPCRSPAGEIICEDLQVFLSTFNSWDKLPNLRLFPMSPGPGAECHHRSILSMKLQTQKNISRWHTSNSFYCTSKWSWYLVVTSECFPNVCRRNGLKCV